jgi:hypothetical protein
MTNPGARYTDKKREYDRKYREEHRDAIHQMQKNWYARNREHAIAHVHNWRVAHLEYARAWGAKWTKDNPDKCREYQRTRRENHREKVRAGHRVFKAIKSGMLIPQPCEVCGVSGTLKNGSRKIHAHHDDYAIPLKVRWLCQRHHLEIHRLARERARVPEEFDL